MAVIVAIFADPKDVTAPDYDGRVVRFSVALVPCEHFGTPREKQNTRNIRVRMEVSGSWLAGWQHTEAQLIKALYQLARGDLESKLNSSTISDIPDELVIRVNTGTQPFPIDIDHIDFNGLAVVKFDIRHPIGFSTKGG